MAQTQLRSSQRRKARHSYREPDTDTEFEYEALTKPRSRPTRSSQRLQTYREDTTSDEEDDEDDDDGNPSAPESQAVSSNERSSNRGTTQSNPRRNRVRRSRRTKQSFRKNAATPIDATLNPYKRRKVGHIDRVNDKATNGWDKVVLLPVNTHAPPWQTLEYHLLLKIMQYAAYPLYSSAFRSSPMIEWLAGVSTLCRSFRDAAIAALLWEPPILPVYHVHGLVGLLSQDQERLSVNHRTKIRSLNLEVKHVLVKKSGIRIEEILKYTPQLSRLRIFHGHDEMVGKAIWAEPSMSHFKWSYGGLFESLDEHSIRLKAFEWSGRFQDTVGMMATAHQRPCLNDLEEISIVNFNFAEKQEVERVCIRNKVISAFSPFANLKVIEFRNCTIADTTTMSQLPLGLRSLKIVNCLSLTSEAVETYLTLGGQSIRTLHLEGNQVMDLAFIPKLAELCPRLENLHLDLSYEDCSSYRDRNPLYDELLPNGGPTWPSSLCSIMVGPLRSLTVSDAEGFYNSLIDAADSLPYLRVLNIKTLLKDASWRDRANLRKKWRPLFEKVFAANKMYVPTVTKPKPIKQDKAKSSQRKSARLQEQEDLSVSEEIDDGDVSFTSGMSSLPRQNLCEIVEFDLSDQRPAQEQFREADFLDSEPSGDDEWNGRDEGAAGTGYAW